MSVRRVLRTALFVLGVYLTLLGLWWIAEGTGLVAVDFMAGQMQWAWRGLALAAMGIALAVAAARMKV